MMLDKERLTNMAAVFCHPSLWAELKGCYYPVYL